ncbi:hypothetical protein ILYODFUR_011569 [Ilyodon furcidens]|uniref:Uncharacterized protein n=1 Tax=Ilyodon furcidens TaxID=33524 RepID=A0ABV0TI28_9TELE
MWGRMDFVKKKIQDQHANKIVGGPGWNQAGKDQRAWEDQRRARQEEARGRWEDQSSQAGGGGGQRAVGGPESSQAGQGQRVWRQEQRGARRAGDVCKCTPEGARSTGQSR